MSHLLDVNFLLACGWSSHAQHAVARAWLEAQTAFTTCPLSELGFLRVSICAKRADEIGGSVPNPASR